MKRNHTDNGYYETLRLCVERVIEKIYTSESYLIDHGVSEWAISAQFYYWMRRFLSVKFKGYNFDAEYNHMGLITNKDKAMKLIGVNGKLKSVRPDLIIHKRGDTTANLLWVELKRHGGNGWQQDLDRVRAVTQILNDHKGIEFITGYKYGLCILFYKREIWCEWSQNGDFFEKRVGSRSGDKIGWEVITKSPGST